MNPDPMMPTAKRYLAAGPAKGTRALAASAAVAICTPCAKRTDPVATMMKKAATFEVMSPIAFRN